MPNQKTQNLSLGFLVKKELTKSKNARYRESEVSKERLETMKRLNNSYRCAFEYKRSDYRLPEKIVVEKELTKKSISVFPTSLVDLSTFTSRLQKE